MFVPTRLLLLFAATFAVARCQIEDWRLNQCVVQSNNCLDVARGDRNTGLGFAYFSAECESLMTGRDPDDPPPNCPSLLKEATQALCIQGSACKRCYIPELMKGDPMTTLMQMNLSSLTPRCPPCVYTGLGLQSVTKRVCDNLYIGSSLLLPEQEVPPLPAGKSLGRGVASYQLDTMSGLLSFEVAWTNLTDTTTTAHIHRGFMNMSGPVVLPILPPVTTSANGTISELQVIANHGFARGAWQVPSADELQRLIGGGYYLNVHSAMFPAGEVRDQIRLVRTDTCVQQCVNLNTAAPSRIEIHNTTVTH